MLINPVYISGSNPFFVVKCGNSWNGTRRSTWAFNFFVFGVMVSMVVIGGYCDRREYLTRGWCGSYDRVNAGT